MQLYNDDCRNVMRKMIEDGIKVDLIITSPPYGNLRTYNNSSVWNFEIFKEIADLLYSILNDGGVIVWVVGDQTIKGSETLDSFRQALYFQSLGLLMHDTMIYEKNSSSYPARRDGNRYTQIFEYMFILSKGKPKTCNLICDKPNKWAGSRNWGRNTNYTKDGKLVQTNNIKPIPSHSVRNNIWRYTVGFNVNIGKHPAVFPYKLAEDHVMSWSNEGDLVFDPFMGSGTTYAASLLNNRDYMGCEIDKDYFSFITDNIEKYKKKMNVIYSIKIHNDNLQELQKLKFLSRVDVGEDGKSITVQIKDNCTRGSLIARTGDYIVQYATGDVQRFGIEAYSLLVKNPSAKNAKEY